MFSELINLHFQETDGLKSDGIATRLQIVVNFMRDTILMEHLPGVAPAPRLGVRQGCGPRA